MSEAILPKATELMIILIRSVWYNRKKLTSLCTNLHEWVTQLVWRVLIIFTTLMASPLALAEAKSVNPESLSIELLIPPSVPDVESKEIESAWKNACASLGSAFKIKGNYFFHGIASSHRCRLPSKKKRFPKKDGWTLKVVPDQTSWTLTMYYGRSAEPEARLVISGGTKVIKALADRQIAMLVAMRLMDDLPMARFIDERSVKNSFSYEDKSENEKLAPIEEYNIFGMTYLPDRNLWIPKVMGKAVLQKDEKKGLWNWRVKLDEPLQPDQAYWAQDARGRGSNASQLSENLKGELSKHNISGNLFDEATQTLYDSLVSGYVGIRYGYPISKSDSLISEAAMVGIFTEVRGGPLEGLRWYWDFAPEVKKRINGEIMNFSWSRPSIGWSFGLKFNSLIVNRIDVTPKIGLMDLDAKVPFETSRGIVPVKFRFKNATNLGIEVGVETASPWFIVRIWGATDASGFVDLGGPGTIKSLRGGIDTYWDLYKLSDHIELSVLVFGFGEKLSLAKNKGEVDASSNVRIEAIGYEFGIVGAGLILVW